MIYHAVNNRCLVDLHQLNLPISATAALSILEQRGFHREERDVVELARQLLGKPYRRGARLRRAPELFDCSSLTKWLYAEIGVWLPRRAIQQRESGMPIELSDIGPGDLIFTSGWINRYVDDPQDGVGHVGIASSASTVIHAANKQAGVIESTVGSFVRNNSFRGARRIADLSRAVTLSLPATREIETSDDIRHFILTHLPCPS
ncbi:MAG: NlpC/P60 family protein [Patescibacteria group bacterium]